MSSTPTSSRSSRAPWLSANRGSSSITDVRYLGTVTQGEEAIANYMAYGKFNSGADAVLGFAVRVRDGDVVGVN